MFHASRSLCVAVAAGLFGAPPLAANTPPAMLPGVPLVGALPDDPAAQALDFGTDATQRMTVPVTIGGTGPYDFIVDTGAERTVISSQLARKLGLREGEAARLHSMTEVGSVRTVIIPSLEMTRTRVTDIQAPALDGVHLGAVGLLGLDSLKAQRVVIDFKRGQMTVSPAARHRALASEPDVIVVSGKSRYGQLILADARVGPTRIRVIVDTGAQISVANMALRRKLAGTRRDTGMNPVELLSVTGGRLDAGTMVIKQMKVGDVTFTNLPIAFVDAHPFRKFGLANTPALLLGMDALRLFDRVAVDFTNREVRFLMPSGAERNGRAALATNTVHGRDSAPGGLAGESK